MTKHECKQSSTTRDRGGGRAITTHCQHIVTLDDPFEVNCLFFNLHMLHCARVHYGGGLHLPTVCSHLVTYLAQLELGELNVLEGALELHVVASVLHTGDSDGGFQHVAGSAITRSTSMRLKVDIPAPPNMKFTALWCAGCHDSIPQATSRLNLRAESRRTCLAAHATLDCDNIPGHM
ncbi:unnamed protein product [Mesocestoides corti]|uniref:Uncharacterized protein n=1 Tax=Mesocestoides corti TaxID=53468 RepID=A0A0R3UD22_MESCO|nr:unnamed protein product [Mesocestoides corti]